MHDCTVRRVHIYATILIAGVSLLAGGCGEKTADESAPTAAAAEEPAASAAKVAEAKPAAADEGVMKLTVAKADPAKLAAKKAAKAKAEDEAVAAARAALEPIPDGFHGSWIRRDEGCTKSDCEGSRPRDAMVVVTKFKIFYQACECEALSMNIAQLTKGENKDGTYTFTYDDGKSEGSLEKLPNGVLLTLDSDDIAATIKRPKGYKHRVPRKKSDTKAWRGEWAHQDHGCTDSDCEKAVPQTLGAVLGSSRLIYETCECSSRSMNSLPIIAGTFTDGIYYFQYGDADFPKNASLEEVSDGLMLHIEGDDFAALLRRPKARKPVAVKPAEDTSAWRGEWFFADHGCTDSQCEAPRPRVQGMTLTGSRLIYKTCECDSSSDTAIKLKDSAMNDGIYTFKTADDEAGVLEMTPDGLLVDIQDGLVVLARRKKSGVKLKTVMEAGMQIEADSEDAGSESCDEYVECVCDLGEALADETGSDPYKGMCKAAKKLLTKAQGKACSMALNAFKRGLKAAKSGYEMMGIDIPSSCE